MKDQGIFLEYPIFGNPTGSIFKVKKRDLMKKVHFRRLWVPVYSEAGSVWEGHKTWIFRSSALVYDVSLVDF